MCPTKGRMPSTTCWPAGWISCSPRRRPSWARSAPASCAPLPSAPTSGWPRCPTCLPAPHRDSRTSTPARGSAISRRRIRRRRSLQPSTRASTTRCPSSRTRCCAKARSRWAARRRNSTASPTLNTRMASHRPATRRQAAMSAAGPLRILCSELEARALAPQLRAGTREIRLCHPGDLDAAHAEVGFISRDITGRSTKFEILPDTERFYRALRAARGLRWLPVHSAGLARDLHQEPQRRGVRVTASHGASDAVVAQTAIAGVLALARHFPHLLRAQRPHAWEPLLDDHLPRDLEGQRAVIVGWGGIGQRIGLLLQALGLEIAVARHSGEPAGAGIPTVRYGGLRGILPGASWLVLACPLTDATRG